MQQIVSKEGLADGNFVYNLPTKGAHQQIWKLRRVFPRRPSGSKPWKRLWKFVKQIAADGIMMQVISASDTAPPARSRFVVPGLGVPRIKQAVEETS